MYIAHGPISFLANEALQRKNISKLTKGEHIAIALFSIFFGILPDFDLFVLSMTNVPSFQHHQYFSHSILFYILVWILLRICIYIGYKILNKDYKQNIRKEFLDVLQKTFLIGVLSHLFADILFSYSQILQPLQTEITLLGNIFPRNYFASNIFTVSTSVEIFLISLFVYFFYKIFFKKNILLKYGIYTLIGLSSLLLLLSIYMSFHTYNRSTYRVRDMVVHDADFDSLIDYKDWDTDNDGISNIEDVDRDLLIKDSREILEGEYFVVGKEGILNKVKDMYGAFNSYRLISQSFFNQNLAIEPVLLRYARSTHDINEYSVNYEYSDLLYIYLNNNDMLEDFDVNALPGKIFFVLNKDEQVVNMGIVYNTQEGGIVLSQDSKTSVHKFDDILFQYQGFTLKVQK